MWWNWECREMKNFIKTILVFVCDTKLEIQLLLSPNLQFKEEMLGY